MTAAPNSAKKFGEDKTDFTNQLPAPRLRLADPSTNPSLHPFPRFPLPANACFRGLRMSVHMRNTAKPSIRAKKFKETSVCCRLRFGMARGRAIKFIAAFSRQSGRASEGPASATISIISWVQP